MAGMLPVKKAMSIAVLALLLSCAVSLAGEAPARQPDAFAQLLAKVQADPRRAPEEQVKQLLTMAAQRGRCHAVSIAVKSHLAHNFHAPPELLRLAANNPNLLIFTFLSRVLFFTLELLYNHQVRAVSLPPPQD